LEEEVLEMKSGMIRWETGSKYNRQIDKFLSDPISYLRAVRRIKAIVEEWEKVK